MERQGITGHSMGGHGALTVSLRNPGRFRSTSAFAPIVSPINCPWGRRRSAAISATISRRGGNYDACALIKQGARLPELAGRPGNRRQLPRYVSLRRICWTRRAARSIWPATIRMQEGYDHSYLFISTFMAEHVAWHAERLKK
jgi:S-formylglutathione hydrolase